MRGAVFILFPSVAFGAALFNGTDDYLSHADNALFSISGSFWSDHRETVGGVVTCQGEAEGGTYIMVLQ